MSDEDFDEMEANQAFTPFWPLMFSLNDNNGKEFLREDDDYREAFE